MQLIFQHRARIATLPASNHYILLGALQGPTHCNAVINTQHRNPEQEERPNSVSSLSALHTKKKEGPTNTPSKGPQRALHILHHNDISVAQIHGFCSEAGRFLALSHVQYNDTMHSAHKYTAFGPEMGRPG